MPEELQVRPFRDEPLDRAGLSEVVAGAFELDRWVRDPLFAEHRLGPMFAAGALAMAERAATSPEDHFALLALRGPRVVGVALGHLEAGLLEFTGVKVGTLWSLAVRPDQRRRGVARRLFGEARAWMEARGCRQLNVSTDAENPANELYRQAGCTPRHLLRTWGLPLGEGP